MCDKAVCEIVGRFVARKRWKKRHRMQLPPWAVDRSWTWVLRKARLLRLICRWVLNALLVTPYKLLCYYYLFIVNVRECYALW